MTTASNNSTTWTIDIPTEPTANIVLIKNISTETKEATIKDFFSFCGVIKAFEMKLDAQDEKHQVAIVYFEQDSAAKTATLLSQAVVDDSPIAVEPYFKASGEPMNIETINKGTNAQQSTAATSQQETKSVSHVMTELLASGYVLTESVIAKGAEFDEKHGVSTKVNGYLSKVGINLTHLNQRFHSTSNATATTTTTNDDNTTVPTRSATAPAATNTTASPSRMQNLMKSRAGLKVQGIASRVADKVSTVHEEAKRIAAEKKKDSINMKEDGMTTTISKDDHKPIQ